MFADIVASLLTRFVEAGRSIAVDFWDTAGQERFNNLHPSYFYRAHACVLAFDVTRKVRRVSEGAGSHFKPNMLL
jgi:GTPase SAR1 family protein